MKIELDRSSLRETRWYEYAVRFLFGGVMTVITGLIAKKFGPVVGGLFLAFPAILPASATLIEKHEKEKKQAAGLNGEKRGRQVASVDAAGAAMGTLGLFVFALIVRQFISEHNAWVVLLIATLVSISVSVLAWLIRKRT
jgi:hypothetical protein